VPSRMPDAIHRHRQLAGDLQRSTSQRQLHPPCGQADAAATPSLRKAGTASPGSLLSPGCSMTFPDSVPAGHDHEAANAEAGAYRPCRRSQRRGTAGGDAAEGVPTIGPAAARLLSGPRYLHAAVQQRDQESSSNPFAPSSLVLSDRASVKVEELSKRDAISEEDFQILYGTLP
jgi:hypothetical protein